MSEISSRNCRMKSSINHISLSNIFLKDVNVKSKMFLCQYSGYPLKLLSITFHHKDQNTIE